ncbi:hypothetical protein SBA2_430036 [Acidobacteriia bacterium SbA2]|nr:hypothetical protein SBA2_430036 [Acidobacteriia bacterium SbA2]
MNSGALGFTLPVGRKLKAIILAWEVTNNEPEAHYSYFQFDRRVRRTCLFAGHGRRSSASWPTGARCRSALAGRE